MNIWLEAMTRASIQGGAALGAVWIAGRLLPWIAPRVQCWFWRLAFLKLLAAAVWTGPIDLPLLPPAPALEGPEPAVQSAREFRAASVDPARAVRAGLPNTVAPWLFGFWLLTVAAGSARLCAELCFGRRVLKGCRPLLDSESLAEARAAADRVGLRRPFVLYESDQDGPCVIAAGKPAVVLPAEAWRSASRQDRRFWLAHEMAHLARGDLRWAWLPALSRIGFGFHPLVWLGCREARLAQELACDELAVRAASRPASEYADLLLRMASRGGLQAGPGHAGLGARESTNDLRRRLRAMKKFSVQGRNPAPAAVLTGLCAVGILVPWRVVAQTAKGGPVAGERAESAAARQEERDLRGQVERLAREVEALRREVAASQSREPSAARPASPEEPGRRQAIEAERQALLRARGADIERGRIQRERARAEREEALRQRQRAREEQERALRQSRELDARAESARKAAEDALRRTPPENGDQDRALMREMEEMRRALREKEKRIQELEEKLRRRDGASSEALRLSLADQGELVRSRLAEARTRFTESHPLIKGLKLQLLDLTQRAEALDSARPPR